MSTLVDKTPYEASDGRRNSLSHLIFFGCDAFLHIPKLIRKKLNNKSEKCLFIKYKDGIKGYKLWNLVTRTVVYNRDVIFKEDESTSMNEDLKIGKELENIEFNLNNESHDSDGSTKLDEEVEPKTLVIRRFG